MNSQTPTLMSIDQWCNYALLDKWQVAGYCIDDPERGCDCPNATYTEWMWQGKYLSRAEISAAMAQAEQLLADTLGYWIAPKAFENEVHVYPDHRLGRNLDASPYEYTRSHMGAVQGTGYKNIPLKWGYIQNIGTLVSTDLGETASLFLSSDGSRFTAVLNLATEPSANSTYHAFFATEDLPDGADKTNWELRDLAFEICNSGATWWLEITGGAYLLMPPLLRNTGRRWDCLRPTPTDTYCANYVQKLQVSVDVLDATQHGSLQWGINPCLGTNCPDTTSRGTCLMRDDTPLNPYVSPQAREYNAETEEWEDYCITGAPNFVLANYIAGIPRTASGLIHPLLGQAAFYLSASLLETGTPNCQCDDNAGDRLAKFRDVEKTVLKDVQDEKTVSRIERVLAQKENALSLWGTRYGAVRAWKIIENLMFQGVIAW